MRTFILSRQNFYNSTKNIIVMLLFAFLYSCENNLQKDIRKVYGQTMSLPSYINHKDILVKQQIAPRLKLVTYYNSKQCLSCVVDYLHQWKQYVELPQITAGQFKLILIFSPTDELTLKKIMLTLKVHNLENNAYIDENNELKNSRIFSSIDSRFHTFLLDKDNKVILVGNPLKNPKIEELFYKIVEEKLGKK